MAFSISAAAQGSTFISGLEDGYSFIADKCGAAGKATSFSTSGKSFKVMTFYYNSSTVTAVEDAAGKRSILFIDGKPNMPTSATYPKIGYNGANELKTNEYAVGPHDFTDDGRHICVRIYRNGMEMPGRNGHGETGHPLQQGIPPDRNDKRRHYGRPLYLDLP